MQSITISLLLTVYEEVLLMQILASRDATLKTVSRESLGIFILVRENTCDQLNETYESIKAKGSGPRPLGASVKGS